VLEIAPDLAQQECDAALQPGRLVRPGRRPAPDAEVVARVAERMAAWKRAAILVGQDVVHSQATKPLLQLAELLGAAIVFTRLGKGAVDDRHRLVVGNCRSPQARTLREAADGLLAVGVRFTQIDTLGWKDRFPAELIQLDRDPAELGREYPVALGVAGDLAATLESLCGALRERTPQAPAANADWSARVAELKRERDDRAAVPVLSQIREGLPDDGILAVDVTSLGYRAFDEFPVPGPRQFLYPCHYVTLGFCFPAALGAKIAAPQHAVVALCGDGGFLMTAMDLALAVERQIPLVSVVVADGCLTAIKGSQLKHYGGRAIATDMHVPDFVALARSFGAHGMRAEQLDDLPELIAQGIRRRGPTVIEVPMHERVDEIIEKIPWLFDR
jgi:acetolactate synthase-1/2/3 large subunit